MLCDWECRGVQQVSSMISKAFAALMIPTATLPRSTADMQLYSMMEGWCVSVLLCYDTSPHYLEHVHPPHFYVVVFQYEMGVSLYSCVQCILSLFIMRQLLQELSSAL